MSENVIHEFTYIYRLDEIVIQKDGKIKVTFIKKVEQFISIGIKELLPGATKEKIKIMLRSKTALIK